MGLSVFADAALGLSAAKPDEITVTQVCVRSVLVFFILLAFIRLAKKRFLGEATGLDVILVIVIGSIVSRAISGTAPFFASLAATFVLIVAHWVVSFFTRDYKLLSRLVMGNETVLIRDGRVDKHALRAAHMSDEDLAEDLRQEGVRDSNEVELAVLERSGHLSVIKSK